MANIDLLTAREAAGVAPVLARIVAGNEERKRITQTLTQDLIAAAESDPVLASRATLVFAGEGWHPGIVGIVASRLVERFGKPTAVISIEEGVAKGSLRTIAAVHLGEAVDACRHLLTRGGGHAMAAGISLSPDQIGPFREAFERHVATRIAPGSLGPRTEYDCHASVAELNADFFASLESLAPFGNGNCEPLILLTAATLAGRPRLFGKGGDHVRAPLTDAGGGMRELLAWRAKAMHADLAAPGRRFDFLVRPEAGLWRGEAQHRLVFVDGRAA